MGLEGNAPDSSGYRRRGFLEKPPRDATHDTLAARWLSTKVTGNLAGNCFDGISLERGVEARAAETKSPPLSDWWSARSVLCFRARVCVCVASIRDPTARGLASSQLYIPLTTHQMPITHQFAEVELKTPSILRI